METALALFRHASERQSGIVTFKVNGADQQDVYHRLIRERGDLRRSRWRYPLFTPLLHNSRK